MCIRKCGRNDVIVISGCGVVKNKCVKSGSYAFVLPGQKLQRLSTKTKTLCVKTKNVTKNNGIPVSVSCQVQVKVNAMSDEMLQIACDALLGKTDQVVDSLIRQCISAAQSSVLASVTPEDIFSKTQQVNESLVDCISRDLVQSLGMGVISCVVQDWSDEQGYFQELRAQQMINVKAEKGQNEEDCVRRAAEMREDGRHKDEAERIKALQVEKEIEEEMRIAMEWETTLNPEDVSIVEAKSM